MGHFINEIIDGILQIFSSFPQNVRMLVTYTIQTANERRKAFKQSYGDKRNRYNSVI